ncbi:MAG TPA: alpha/beta hydrolase [Chloroflexota bacterium]|jgi:pimeloyl-ACP methyl ester carboxylesterase
MPVAHRFVETNGIRMHIAEAGSGPLVVLLHGFPESWYSWRHQLAALSEAGFHVVAPDQRGYGQTDRPEAVEDYTMFHLVGDVIGLLDALGGQQAVVVGHDWGAPVAWHTALWRADRVRGVAGLSVPYRPRGNRPPLTVLRELRGEGFYQIYFQQPGVAEADLQRDVRATIRMTLYGASGQSPIVPDMIIRPGQRFLNIGQSGAAVPLPDWVEDKDVDFYTAEFERTGFTGGLNWYRNIDRNWELTAPWVGAQITPPALFVVGDRDVVYHFPGGGPAMLDSLRAAVPNLKQGVVLEGCGHWTQQERSADVNRLLLDFLRSL